jgi:hypothetical protein
VGCFDSSNEPLGFINGGEFLDQLSKYQFLKKDSAHIIQVSCNRKPMTQGHVFLDSFRVEKFQ